jgi:stage II sporulation protein D
MQRTTRQILLPALALFTALAFQSGGLLRPVESHAASFRVTGKGWGHGIGMSQYGAKGYASRGWTYNNILAHYYQQTTLGSVASKNVLVNVDPSANYGTGGNDGYTKSYWTLRSGRAGGTLQVKDPVKAKYYKLLPDRWYKFQTVLAGQISIALIDMSTGAQAKDASGTAIPLFTGASVDVYDTNASPLIHVAERTGGNAYYNVRYRGFMRLSKSGYQMKLVNVVPLQHYLYGVVPRESPSSWPAEALKAQAVAARSYAYPSGGEIYCTTSSQVYMGHSSGVPGGTTKLHEATTSNAAVDATNGKVVKYGSTIVKTFFFSNSGGHTANIGDVWSGSAAAPYYTGVVDPYEGLPAWTPVDYTGLAIGQKLGVAAAVTAVAGWDRAASGYVRSVSLKFSDGLTRTYSGGTFRTKLGLKSTKFYVTPLAYRYDDRYWRLRYSATGWSNASDPSFFNGTAHDTGARGATARITMKGTGVALIGKKGPNGGKAAVYIDGRYIQTIDLYSPTVQYDRAIWSKLNMHNTRHSIVLKCLRTRNPSSTSYHVWLDAVDVYGGSLVSP